MSNSNNRMIVFASILGAILATGLLALNPSIIENAQAQMYANEYGYDNGYNNNYYYPESKNSYKDIQKIKCVNSNLNVNGIDITQIPQDATATAAENEEASAVGANTQNGNALADRINVERNLVNVCVNVNENEQIKAEEGPQLTTTTLRVTVEVVCLDESNSGVSIQQQTLCELVESAITEDQYIIDVIDTNPDPSQFPGSEGGQLVKLNPGNYVVKEASPSVFDEMLSLSEQQEFNFGLNTGIFTGDCTPSADNEATGKIGEGESQTCNIENRIFVSEQQ